jgi:uncharacterized membrane protein (TIGR02234 family)
MLAAQDGKELPMTALGRARPGLRGPRQELALIVLLGAAGAGLVWLAIRQGWADVETAAPKPLPVGMVRESGEALVPAAGALAIAALAGLAAVLATRGAARRGAGVILAAFGAGIIAVTATGVSAAAVLSAAAASDGSQAGSSGTAAGSVTAGGAGTSGAPLSGFPARVVFASFPWQAVVILGGVAIIAAGALVTWRAGHLPVMSARFDRSQAGQARAGDGHGGRQPGGTPGDSASIWEALSRGEDPTSPGASGHAGRRP